MKARGGVDAPTALALACAALAAASLAAQEPACPRPGDEGLLEGVTPPDSSQRSEAYWAWGNGLERRNLGVGYLEPRETGDDAGAATPPSNGDWLPHVTLPLFWTPAEDDAGVWIHRGWWIPIDPPRDRLALTYRGMVETDYEAARPIVISTREDGWIELWVDPGPLGPGETSGRMWTRRCLLGSGELALDVVLWSERFAGADAPPLSFRDESRHALRTGPAPDAERTAWLQPRDEVELLEVRGDWARVRAYRPGVYLAGCLGETWEGEALEGWIRWRDDERGTWLWYPTRGC